MLKISNNSMGKYFDDMWNNAYESWIDANEVCWQSKNRPNESFWHNLRELVVTSARAKALELKYKAVGKVGDIFK